MYRNRIGPGTKLQSQFSFRNTDIDYEIEKRKYVEFVCDIWVQGRFGPDRVTPIVIDLTDRPELERAVFYDIYDDDEMVPCYLLLTLGRGQNLQVEPAFQRAGLSHANNLTEYSCCLGRGSPQIVQHQRCVVIQPAATPQESDPVIKAASRRRKISMMRTQLGKFTSHRWVLAIRT